MIRSLWLLGLLALLGAPARGTEVAPSRDPAVPLSRIAFGSCSDQDKPLPIFDAMAAAKPELLVLLGDTIYADLDKTRKVTTEVIREKYGVLAKLPGWQRLKATCPMVATWDDHDYGLNDAGAEWPLKDESQGLFHDFFGTPPDSPKRKLQGVYSSEVYGPAGKRVQILMLDTRYFRSPLKTGTARNIAPYGMIRKPYLPNTDEGVTMLGEAQWKWLAEELKKPAELRLIGSSIQFLSTDHPFEKWGNFPAEREKLVQTIRAAGATGVVVLSGDRHLGELSVSTGDLGYPLYDLTSSGFNMANPGWRAPEPNRHRVSSMPYGHNFGWVGIDWGASPTVTLQLRDVKGEVALSQTFPISLLQTKDEPKTKPKTEKETPKHEVPAGVLTPAEAAKKVGETVKVQFEVKSGRAVNDGKRILLNSDEKFTAKENFTVLLNGKGMTGKFDKATYDTFKGKTIRASGKVTLYKESPQIQIDDPAELEIVEAKAEKTEKK